MSELKLTISEPANEIFTALAKAQAEIGTANKDSLNPHFKSKYADLASVWEACRAALTKNSICVVQVPSADGNAVSVTTILGHASGQKIVGELTMIAKGSDPQSVGSCLTYLRRYSLASLVSVCPDDDDGNAATGKPEEHKRSAPKAEPPHVEPSAEFETLKQTLYDMGVPKGNVAHANAVLDYGYKGATVGACSKDAELSTKALNGLLDRAIGKSSGEVYEAALEAAGLKVGAA